jgi:hypothetical protein
VSDFRRGSSTTSQAPILIAHWGQGTDPLEVHFDALAVSGRRNIWVAVTLVEAPNPIAHHKRLYRSSDGGMHWLAVYTSS